MAANSKGDQGETLTLQWLLNAGGISPTRPTQRKVKLYTTLPSEANAGGTEVSTSNWTNYAPQDVTFGAVSGTSPVQCSNNATVDFGTAAVTGANVELAGYAITDQTGGILYGPYSFATAIVVQNGNPVSFASGALVCQED